MWLRQIGRVQWLSVAEPPLKASFGQITSDTIPNTACGAERRETQSLLSWTPETRGSRKECAVVAGLLGVVLLLFELVLIARMVVDWIGVLSPDGGSSGLDQARRITHGITEPVIGPVRRVLEPARVGAVPIHLAVTAVVVAGIRRP